ncbi:MAG: hypothetical protein WCD18_09020 [Thermosynechococcaceae cyanobacterium]
MNYKEIIVFNPFVSDEYFSTTLKELSRVRFHFGAISTNPKLPIWHGEVSKQSVAIQLALKTVRGITRKDFDLVSCHINLQTHGLDGAFHTDDNDPNGDVTHALNWYVHPYDWPVEFGGYLLIGDNQQNLRAILPKQNSAVFFPANFLHCATAPFLSAGSLARISLALKLRLNHDI